MIKSKRDKGWAVGMTLRKMIADLPLLMITYAHMIKIYSLVLRIISNIY